MTEIVLVRRSPLPPPEEARVVLRHWLFDCIGGLNALHQKRWVRLVRWLLEVAEPGEYVTLKSEKKRSGPFHRRHMLIEARVFDAQERIPDFEQFRYWLKVGAGFVDWMAGPKGGVVPVPKSISYEKCEDDEMREFHESAIAFLRSEHAIKYLWPKLAAPLREQAINAVLDNFNE